MKADATAPLRLGGRPSCALDSCTCNSRETPVTAGPRDGKHQSQGGSFNDRLRTARGASPVSFAEKNLNRQHEVRVSCGKAGMPTTTRVLMAIPTLAVGVEIRFLPFNACIELDNDHLNR